MAHHSRDSGLESRGPRRMRLVVAAVTAAVAVAAAVAVWSLQSPSGPTALEQDESASLGSPLQRPQSEPTPGVTATPSPSASQSQAKPATTPEQPKSAPTTPRTNTSTKKAIAPTNPRTIKAFITGYSYFDNTPAGSVDISNPVLHQSAGGTGTYADPITVAVGHSFASGHDVLDWAPGTRFYIPNLRRYFIVEDTCGDGSTPQNGPCHTGFASPATTWLDIWIGGKGGSKSGSDACMDAITNVWQVVVNPGPNYATTAGSVYGASGCARQYGDSIVLS